MIEVEDLAFSYPSGREELFESLTARFPEGSVSVVTGRSGRGKSTLLYLIGLLLTPTRGNIRFDGIDVGGLPDRSRSRIRADRVGFVFQDAALDPSRSVLDNVVEGALYAGTRRRVAEVHAIELLDRFDIDVDVARRPGEVSGGQAQRIGLCRALVKHPTLLLADEPTGNLDPATATVVLEALGDAARNDAAVIIASHDPQVIAHADHVVEL